MLSRARDDAGSALMLMPAAVLIMVVLAALAVDLSHVQLADRQLRTLAADAANDAVGAGLDQETLRATGAAQVDPRRADELARTHVWAERPSGCSIDRVQVTTGADGTVRVTIDATVRYIFGAALPGTSGETTLSVTASAHPEQR